MTECPTRLTLMMFKTAELEGRDFESVRRHVEICEKCRSIITALEQKDARGREIRDRQLHAIKSRLEASQPSVQISGSKSKRFRLTALAAAAALLLVTVVFAITQTRQAPQPASQSVRFKGALGFDILATRAGHEFEVESDNPARVGDRLRFVLRVASAGFLSFVRLNNQGQFSPVSWDEDTAEMGNGPRAVTSGDRLTSRNIMVDRDHTDSVYLAIFSKHKFDIQTAVKSAKKRATDNNRVKSCNFMSDATQYTCTYFKLHF